MDDLIKSLRERAVAARGEGNATANCDAVHFERSADRISALEARVKVLTEALDAVKRRAVLHPDDTDDDRKRDLRLIFSTARAALRGE